MNCIAYAVKLVASKKIELVKPTEIEAAQQLARKKLNCPVHEIELSMYLPGVARRT